MPENQSFIISDLSIASQTSDDISHLLPPDAYAYVGYGLTPQPDEGLQFNMHTQKFDKEGKITANYGSVGPDKSLFTLDKKGNFHNSRETTISMKRGFDKKRAGKEYEFWRLFMFSRLYDMTRRAEIVERMPSIDSTEHEIASDMQEGKDDNQNQPKYKILVVPRIKFDALTVKDSSSGEELRRFTDRHKVTWHIRRLPKGYHPTDRAIEYAGEHGLQLGEHETIVREHFRGQERESDLFPSHIKYFSEMD